MRAYRKAFESEDEVKLWKRDNCMDCQNFSNCELKEHIGMEMEIKHAFKVGYEDIGFGYIVLDKLCRYSFPNRLGDYVRIKGFKK